MKLGHPDLNSPAYGLYIPHSSDETLVITTRGIAHGIFISHIVQMKLVKDKVFTMISATLYPT